MGWLAAFFRRMRDWPKADAEVAVDDAILAPVARAEDRAIAAHEELAVASRRLATTVAAKPLAPLADFADLEALLDRRRRRGSPRSNDA